MCVCVCLCVFECVFVCVRSLVSTRNTIVCLCVCVWGGGGVYECVCVRARELEGASVGCDQGFWTVAMD